MTNTQVDKAIRKLASLNDDISRNRFYYTPAVFPYARLLNNFRTVDHWRAYFEAQPSYLGDMDLILQIPELEGFFRQGWSILCWDDDASPEKLFYIDLIKMCPVLAEYGWHYQLGQDDAVTGIRAMIKRLFETKDSSGFLDELFCFYTKIGSLSTTFAFQVEHLVNRYIVAQALSEDLPVLKVYEPKKTRSGKVY